MCHIRAVFCHVKKIHCLKALLTQEAFVTAIHPFVTSRRDDRNSPLYGISKYDINRFRRIQNSAALIATNTRKYDHIIPIIQNLHRRIHFKILLITYKSINGMAPE